MRRTKGPLQMATVSASQLSSPSEVRGTEFTASNGKTPSSTPLALVEDQMEHSVVAGRALK